MKKKFKDLTEEDIEYIKSEYYNKESGLKWEERKDNLAKHFGIEERTMRRWFAKLDISGQKNKISDQFEEAKKNTLHEDKNIFLITYCQNNTDINEELLSNMEAYASFLNAQILVIGGRYKNPTSVFADKPYEFWDKSVIKYLTTSRLDLHKYCTLMADVKVQTSASNPLSTLEGLTHENSCIVGSPRIIFKMLPVLEGCKPKAMLTTGALSKPNYVDSKIGKVAEFQHVYGFAIVEVKDDDVFYFRQVTSASDGSFNDLYYHVSNGIVNRNNSISAVTFGDLHYGSTDERVMANMDSLLSKLVPEHVFLHDVFDGYSINVHEQKDGCIQYFKESRGLNSLDKEIKGMLDYLEYFTKFKKVLIVRSNHDLFLDRYIKDTQWQKNTTPKNSLIQNKLTTLLLEQYETNGYEAIGLIPALIKQRFPQFITLGLNQSYKVKGWEGANHGFLGNSGTKGSINQFRQLNTKLIIGHFHTPSRYENVAAVGTCTKLRLGYNVSASNWLQSSIITHNDGKIQHINFIEDKDGNLGYTTFKY